MKCLVICILCIFCIGCASTKVTLLGVGVIGSSVADVEASRGVEEGNWVVKPFARNRPIFYGVKAIAAAGIIAYTNRAFKNKGEWIVYGSEVCAGQDINGNKFDCKARTIRRGRFWWLPAAIYIGLNTGVAINDYRVWKGLADEQR